MAVKTPVKAIQERCISILFYADIVEGMLGEDLVPRLSLTGNEKRSWAVLLDLVEAERVIQASPAEGSRFRLSKAEKDAEKERRFHLYKPKVKFIEGEGRYDRSC
jgi:hypothetical protein